MKILLGLLPALVSGTYNYTGPGVFLCPKGAGCVEVALSEDMCDYSLCPRTEDGAIDAGSVDSISGVNNITCSCLTLQNCTAECSVMTDSTSSTRVLSVGSLVLGLVAIALVQSTF